MNQSDGRKLVTMGNRIVRISDSGRGMAKTLICLVLGTIRLPPLLDAQIFTEV